MKKRILSILLSVIMLIGMIPLGTIPAFANSFAFVEYIDENGVLQSKFMDNVGVITADTRVIGDGWYIVNKDVALPEDANLTVNGNANIILYDGCTLQITENKISAPGIALRSGNTLNVFGQQIGSGTIDAHGGDNSAGIGGAREGSCGTVNIYGGLVYSCGGYRGQGIGGGFHGEPGAVNVYGGYLYAKGADTYSSIGGTLTVFADQAKNKIMYVRENGSDIAGSPFKSKKENITITPETFLEIETVGVDSKYIDRYWDEENNCVVSVEKNIPSDAVSVTSDTTTLSDGWYVVGKNVSLPQGKHLTVTGNAKLILCDGCTLEILSPVKTSPAIDLSSENSDACSLTVYGQKKGTGRIEAYGGDSAAGIGGGNGAGGKLNICGGSIKVYGGNNSAGIGGGYKADGGTVNVYGGSIEAYGGNKGSGIGGGTYGAGGTLNVYGGKIEAYGGGSGAGIGQSSGYDCKGTLNVYDDCIIHAEGGDSGKGVNSVITLYPDGAESEAPEIHITGDGTEIAGSPFTKKTEISYLNARTVIVGLTGARWTSATTLPTDSGYYVLENDVTLSQGWNVPVNAEITLDLNGHKISRDLTYHTANGYVICVLGKLTLSDNSKNAAGLVTGGGNNGYGGGILACAGSVVTVSDIAVSDNYATTGGGLMISENATVTLNNCKITSNTAVGAAGIYNSGKLTVNGGCLNENHAINNSGGFYADSGSAEFKDCEIKNNRSDNFGGAFFIDYSASVSLDGCTVSGNTAKNGGGAFEMEKDGCVLVLENSSVTGNSVDQEHDSIKKGGGIHFYKGSVTFKGKVTVKDNTCAGTVNNICMRGNTVTFDASELSKDSVVYVNDGVLNDISGITNENVDALIMENGNHIVLNNGKLTNHTPDYTDDYVDNGNGTHSRKCTVCDKLSTPEAHTWQSVDKKTHKCTLCEVVGNHTDSDKNGKCDACGYELCIHENIETVYEWNDDYTVCTATKRCPDCETVFATETQRPYEADLVLDTVGNCKTKHKIHYVVTFFNEEFGTVEAPENTVDFYYGYHTDEDADGVCDECTADLTVTGSIFKSGIFRFMITDDEEKTVTVMDDNRFLITEGDEVYLYPYETAPSAYTGNLVIPETVTYGGKTFTVTAVGMDDVDILNVGGMPFLDCTELSGITLPDTLKVIGEGAFFGCTGLTEIVIPENVEKISSAAFFECDNLKTVTFRSKDITKAPHGDIVVIGAFDPENAVEKVFVPLGTANAYKTEWECFADIIVEVNKYDYLDENGESKTAVCNDAIDSDTTVYTTGWYALTEDAVFDNAIVINGDVKFILCDGATLTANKGILLTEGNKLTVYAQSTGENMGRIIATGDDLCAGIGGGFRKTAGDFTVNGGYVKVTGGYAAPGIGGGFGGKDGTFTKNAGIVEVINGEGYISTHEHTFKTEWSCNELVHWHDAACEHTGYVSEFAEHTFDANGKCTVCGYEKKDSELDEAKTAAKATIDNLVKDADTDITGYADTVKAEIENLTTVTAVTEKLAEAIAEINAKNTAKAIAEALADYEDKVTDLTDKLDKATQELNTVKGQKAELENQLKELQDKADAKDAEIASLKEQIKSLNGQITAKENEINSLNSQLDAAKKEIERLKEQGGDPGTGNTCPKCGGTHANDFFGKIVCFFNRVINWFKNLFK